MMLRQVLRYTVVLFGLQAVFGGIVFLLSDFRVVALLLSLPFFGLVWLAGRSLPADLGYPGRVRTAAAAVLAGLLWQIPGLQGTIRSVSDMVGWTQYDGVTDLQDFTMETWHTVALPLLSAIPTGQVSGYYARYYFALLAVSPALISLLLVASLTVRQMKRWS